MELYANGRKKLAEQGRYENMTQGTAREEIERASVGVCLVDQTTGD